LNDITTLVSRSRASLALWHFYYTYLPNKEIKRIFLLRNFNLIKFEGIEIDFKLKEIGVSLFRRIEEKKTL
jgi:hypothetical protein